MLSGNIKIKRDLHWLMRGIINFFRCVLKYRLFYCETTLIYAVVSSAYQSVYDADVRRVTVDNIEDSKLFQAGHYLTLFRNSLASGDGIFVGGILRIAK